MEICEPPANELAFSKVLAQAKSCLDGGRFSRAQQLLLSAGHPELATDRAQQCEAHAMLAVAAMSAEVDNAEQAELHLREALAIAPDRLDLWSNLGRHYIRRHQYEDAADAYAKVLSLDCDNAEAQRRFGIALCKGGEMKQGIVALRRAVLLAPDDAAAHFSLAQGLLAIGEQGEGWREFEWRLQLPHWLGRRPIAPEWMGENLVGKRILVRSDGRLADVLFFSRYVRQLVGEAREVVMEASISLAGLLRASLGVTVIEPGARVWPRPDYDVPLLSLPARMGNRLDRTLEEFPYLRAPAKQLALAQIRRTSRAGRQPLVALVWRDRDRESKAGRVMPRAFGPLLEIPGVQFVCLQQDPNDAAGWLAAQGVADWSNYLLDLGSVAAALASVDMLISDDKEILHMAGGMGVKSWAMFAEGGDWRWAGRQGLCRWYPSVQVWHPPEGQDIDALPKLLADKLRKALSVGWP